MPSNLSRRTRIAASLLLSCAGLVGQDWKPVPGPLRTQWAADVSPERVHPEYPRPSLVRARWANLNGLWDYRIETGAPAAAGAAAWDGKILVPFPVESSLSGVGRLLEPDARLVYRRRFDVPADWAGARLRLHFGAVDWKCSATLNGLPVGEHRGGYDAFWFDVTRAARPGESNELVVTVEDPTDAGGQPRGKQYLKPHGIWYTRSSGIWRTVWIEPVAEGGVDRLEFSSDVARGEATVVVRVATPREGTLAAVNVSADGKQIASGVGEPNKPIALKLPGARRWSPADPFLYDVTVSLASTKDAKIFDEVRSYCGLREVRVGPDREGTTRILLNGEPLFQYGPLDQGFWPDGLYTAPTDEALRFDIEAVKRMGGNMLRKHVKVEPERFYYWCDRLGVLVWQDVPSPFQPGKGDQAALEPDWRKNFLAETAAIVGGLAHHPSIVMWVPFNEGWGQHDTEAVTAEVKRLDPTRLVNNASGWTDKKVGDVIDIHVYPGPAMAPPEPARASVLGEFGGLGLPVEGRTWTTKDNWGYVSFKNQAELTDAYVKLLGDLPALIGEGLSAAVYTQTTDVEIEVNGWLTYDRAVWKIDPERAAAAARPLYAPPPRLRWVVGRAGKGAPTPWRFTTEDPGAAFSAPDFDAAAWKEGAGGFGTKETPGAKVGTEWRTESIWIRKTFGLDDAPLLNPAWSLHHDEDVEVWLNGVRVHAATGYTTNYVLRPLTPEAKALLKPGRNTLALRCRQTRGGQYLDCGLVDVLPIAPR
jgi:hypothetical protein